MNSPLFLAEGNLDNYSLTNWAIPEIVTVGIATLFIFVFTFVHRLKIGRLSDDSKVGPRAPTGFVLFVEILVRWMRNTVDDILGRQFRWMTPYFLYLLIYIGSGVFLGIIGFESHVTNLTVVAALGLVTWLVTFAFAFRFQKLSYFWKFVYSIKIKGVRVPYFPNPIDTMTVISPLLSLSLRLWGNMFAGSTLVGLIYSFTSDIPFVHYFNVVSGVIAVPFHVYFDFLDGTVQTYIFVLLTMSYWANEMSSHTETQVQETQLNTKKIKLPYNRELKIKVESIN